MYSILLSAKSLLKGIAYRFGFEIKRRSPDRDVFGWLARYDIRTVIDIGANTGQFSSEIRKRLPGAEVYSFEPVKESFEALTRNMKDDCRFHPFNVALGEKEEHRFITVSPYSQSSSLLKMSALHETAFPETKGGPQEEVSIKTLDGIIGDMDIEGNVLVKIDVQGYEYNVIKGGTAVLKKTKIVLIETSFDTIYEGQELFDGIYAVLHELGFNYRGNMGAKKNQFTGENFFEDSIFIREG